MTHEIDLFVAQRKRLETWFLKEALPVWSTHGCDFVNAGFYEKLSNDYSPVEEARRARLVARQIYVFTAAQRLGWDGPSDHLIAHGLAFLTKYMIRPNGEVISAVTPQGDILRGDFELYDYAFVLFALACVRQQYPQRNDLAELALTIRKRMIAGWHHPMGGFEDQIPRRLPLRSNPHMHLLEAALAWIETGVDDLAWLRLADELSNLALASLIDADSGALREFFDGEWRPHPGDKGRIIEPGHQFEWAWLLYRWHELQPREEAITKADRLLHIGEKFGVNTRGAVINELNDDFLPRDHAARLWPQTERIKAWSRYSQRSMLSSVEKSRALKKAAEGTAVLMRYFHERPSGLWHETLLVDDTFSMDLGRASSLYHIVMALEELINTQIIV